MGCGGGLSLVLGVGSVLSNGIRCSITLVLPSLFAGNVNASQANCSHLEKKAFAFHMLSNYCFCCIDNVKLLIPLLKKISLYIKGALQKNISSHFISESL